MQRIEIESQDFSRQEQVPEIGAGMVLTGITVATWIHGTLIRAVLGIFDDDTPL
jgi:hypothetical protein